MNHSNMETQSEESVGIAPLLGETNRLNIDTIFLGLETSNKKRNRKKPSASLLVSVCLLRSTTLID
jgi:hypothetical protein